VRIHGSSERPAPGRAWVALAVLLSVGALFVTLAMAADGGLAPGGTLAAALDWQPGRDAAQPWRPWTSAWVHWSWPHLAVNLAGAAVVAGVGWRARAGEREVLAWLIAWPLTQALLDGVAASPRAMQRLADAAGPLHAYGGLSGVLHAGVVVLGLGLALPRRGAGPAPPFERRHRLVGLALCAGTLAKVLLEAPWDAALRPSGLLGIAVAPAAHACGLAAGTAAWIAVTLAATAQDRTRP
jgi:membrane associated rhomboid family serine protease